MSKVKWYYERLKKMSILEVLHRIKIHIWELKLKKKNIYNCELDYDIKYFDNIYVDKISNDIINEAKNIFNDKVLIFDEYMKVKLPKENKYLFNPINNSICKKNYFKNIDFRAKHINPKPIWEINKQYFLIQLAISYKKTNNIEFKRKCISEMLLWIEDNDEYNTINWCSNLEMAIRNINWMLALSILGKEININDKERIINSIINQVDFIFNRLSLYSSANNHLIGELTFILMASYFIECNKSKKWKKKAINLLNKQIENQFFSDGINKEQSINYQLHTMEMYLLCMTILKRNNDYLSRNSEHLIKNSLNYIAKISESDGNIFNIGDQDSGNIVKILESDDEVLNILHWGAIYFNDKSIIKEKKIYFSNKVYAFWGEEYIKFIKDISQEEINELNMNFDKGGAVIKKGKLKDKKYTLYVDYGEIGMKPLYAHAHSDILSFNLNINEKPIFADMGTYDYKMESGWRDYFRSVNAHNTISINGKNQFGFLGAFICDKSPKSYLKKYCINNIKLETDAYKKDYCKVEREFIKENNNINIIDTIQNLSYKEKDITFYFNLDSKVNVKLINKNTYILSRDDIKLKFTIDKFIDVKLYKGEKTEDNFIAGFQSRKYNQIEESYQFICTGKVKKEEKFTFRIEVI